MARAGRGKAVSALDDKRQRSEDVASVVGIASTRARKSKQVVLDGVVGGGC